MAIEKIQHGYNHIGLYSMALRPVIDDLFGYKKNNKHQQKQFNRNVFFLYVFYQRLCFVGPKYLYIKLDLSAFPCQLDNSARKENSL